MKILHVVENLNRGGLERVVLNLIECQIREGHDCKVICIFEEGFLVEEARNYGAEVVALKKIRGLNYRLILRFREQIIEFCPNVIHTHNPIPNYYTALSCIGLNIPLINTRHGMGRGSYSWKGEFLYRLSLLKTAKCVAVCEAAFKSFIKSGIFPKNRSLVITNGIKTEIFYKSNNNRSDLLLNHKCKSNAVILGAVGRLNHVKDYLTMLEAIKIIFQKMQHVYLFIVGDGMQRSLLEKFICENGLDKNVVLLGDQDNVPYYLSAFDIFIMSSKTEGYSMALLEAAASSLPSVVTDVGGNKEIVQDERTGYLVPPNNAEALASRILELISNGKIDEMGSASKSWVDQNGDINIMAKAYHKCYM